MRSIIIYVFACVLLLTYLSGCSSIRIVDTRTIDGVDFSGLKTYEFLDVKFEDERKYVLSDKVIKAIKNNITKQMESRGFSSSSSPDMFVNIGITVETQQTTRETNYQDARTGYIGQRNYHWEAEEVVVNEYEEGTIVIDIVDADKNPLWTCAVAGTVKGKADKVDERVEEAVSKAFSKFPLPPSSP